MSFECSSLRVMSLRPLGQPDKQKLKLCTTLSQCRIRLDLSVLRDSAGALRATLLGSPYNVHRLEYAPCHEIIRANGAQQEVSMSRDSAIALAPIS